MVKNKMAMMNNFGNMMLDGPLIFSGTKSSGLQDDCDAKDFLREVEIRKEKNNWDNAQTMAIVKAALRRKAATWYFDNLQAVYSAEEFNTIDKDWTLFRPVFCKKWGLTSVNAGAVGPEELANLSRQKPGESVDDFMIRVTKVTAGLIKGRSFIDSFNTPATFTLETTREWIRDANEATKGDVTNTFREHATRVEKHALSRLVESLAKAFITAGLSNDIIRNNAQALQDKRLVDFQDTIRDSARTLEVQPSHNQSNGKGRNGRNGRVHAVEEEEDSEPSEDEVNAVSKNSKKSNNGTKKKNGKKKNKSGKDFNPNLNCAFCKKKGHNLEMCWSKQNVEERLAAAKKANVHATSSSDKDKQGRSDKQVSSVNATDMFTKSLNF